MKNLLHRKTSENAKEAARSKKVAPTIIPLDRLERARGCFIVAVFRLFDQEWIVCVDVSLLGS